MFDEHNEKNGTNKSATCRYKGIEKPSKPRILIKHTSQIIQNDYYAILKLATDW